MATEGYISAAARWCPTTPVKRFRIAAPAWGSEHVEGAR